MKLVLPRRNRILNGSHALGRFPRVPLPIRPIVTPEQLNVPFDMIFVAHDIIRYACTLSWVVRSVNSERTTGEQLFPGAEIYSVRLFGCSPRAMKHPSFIFP